MSPVPLTFGCASVNSGGAWNTPDKIKELFNVLCELGITRLDSGQLYGDCEELLGRADVSQQPFAVDSKVPGGFVPGSLEPGRLVADFHASLKSLGLTKIDTLFIHGPDPSLPLAPALQALDSLHRQGFFARLGLSNYKADDVVVVHKLCTENGWNPPTVYQGNYSAFTRRQESEILPTLRKLGMSFSAYSPLAGGFLARRSLGELTAQETGGRFYVDPTDPEGRKGGLGLYREMFSSRPALVQALAEWSSIADAAGCSSPAEMAVRWIVWDSALEADRGDRVTCGATHLDQLRNMVRWIEKGSLGPDTCAKIDVLWEGIKDVAPLDNLNRS
ncbi:NADP-dependent oxidoreductase domain-containing protein [Nemania serpens]|nr:NADP-dependent oxidoreductase domain-containing protein [Nemania serpens]